MDNDWMLLEENGIPQPSLLEAILDRDNLSQAWKRVRANKGAPGMDGMSIEEFPAFARSQMPRIMEWIRRRVRLCYWKVPRKRRRMLVRLGVNSKEVKKASRSRKGYWRMSQNRLVRLALNNAYLQQQGVPSMSKLWVTFKYGEQANV